MPVARPRDAATLILVRRDGPAPRILMGRRSGGLIEVMEGLSPGDQIVTSGQNRLSNGAKVVIDTSVDLSVTDGQSDG